VILAFYEEPPILVYFILFHFQLDWIPVPQKKLVRKFGSGLVLEKKRKRTQVLVMKIRPSFKD